MATSRGAHDPGSWWWRGADGVWRPVTGADWNPFTACRLRDVPPGARLGV